MLPIPATADHPAVYTIKTTARVSYMGIAIKYPNLGMLS